MAEPDDLAARVRGLLEWAEAEGRLRHAQSNDPALTLDMRVYAAVRRNVMWELAGRINGILGEGGDGA